MLFFFFNDTATTEIYTLSLHDALPIFNDKFEGKRSKLITDDLERKYNLIPSSKVGEKGVTEMPKVDIGKGNIDRKSTRLNSSHANISYAVFCLKKKI